MLNRHSSNIFLVSVLCLVPYAVQAGVPGASPCTAQQICLSHAQMMKNFMTPIPEADRKAAIQLLESCAAQNHPLAQYSTAYAYESGNGVKEDKQRAFDLYLKGAYGGATPAMAMLVDYYNGVMGTVVRVDKAECYAWAIVAGKLGDSRVAARESLCRGSADQKSEGERRAEIMFKKIQANLNLSRVTSCN